MGVLWDEKGNFKERSIIYYKWIICIHCNNGFAVHVKLVANNLMPWCQHCGLDPRK